MDFSPPDSSVHGFFQARILGWVAISFSCLFSFFTPDWSMEPPQDACATCIVDPTIKAYGCMSTLLMGWDLLPFLTPKKPSYTYADGEVFLDLISGHLISLL